MLEKLRLFPLIIEKICHLVERSYVDFEQMVTASPLSACPIDILNWNRKMTLQKLTNIDGKFLIWS
jgi:hypothetical protein